jgi:hypothetical protein
MEWDRLIPYIFILFLKSPTEMGWREVKAARLTTYFAGSLPALQPPARFLQRYASGKWRSKIWSKTSLNKRDILEVDFFDRTYLPGICEVSSELNI